MRFYINKVREEFYINADVSWNNLRARLTVEKISNPENFDKSKNNEKVSAKEKRYSTINNNLKRIRGAVDNYIALLDIKNKTETTTLSSEDFKKEIGKIIHPNSKRYKTEIEESLVQISFIDRFREFISYKQTLDNVSISTTKCYNETLNKFISFQNYYNYEITFELIDIDFYKRFLNYLTNVHVNSKTGSIGVCDNSAANNIKNLKTFLGWAFKQGHHKNTNYLDREFKVKKDNEPPVIALTEDEFKAIVELDLSNNNKLDRVKDLFIFQVHTMLRVSDLMALKNYNFDFENAIINVTTIKTDETIKIPMSNEIKEILKKYLLKLPSISSQKYNEYLKEIAKLAGLNTNIEISRKKGAGCSVEVYKKYELLSSHVARRTGITSLIWRGVNPKLIMQISGHKELKVFEKYIKLANEEALEAVRNAWNS